jgi:hypothetical protein
MKPLRPNTEVLNAAQGVFNGFPCLPGESDNHGRPYVKSFVLGKLDGFLDLRGSLTFLDP